MLIAAKPRFISHRPRLKRSEAAPLAPSHSVATGIVGQSLASIRRNVIYLPEPDRRRAGETIMVVKRIAPLSAAKVAGLIYALIGLAFALLAWIISLVGLNYSGLSGSLFLPFAPGFIVAGGLVAVVILPLVYGAFCFVMTLIGAWLYNLVAGFVGGISIEVQMDVFPDVTAG